jgi:hypothetical protein
MYAGLGAVVVLATAGGIYLKSQQGPQGGSNSSRDSANLTSPAANPSTESTKTVSAGNPAVPNTPVENLNKPLVNVPDSLRAFERYLVLNTDSASAKAVLDRLSKIELSSPAEKADGALLVFNAKLQMNDSPGACQVLRDEVELAPSTHKARILTKIKDLCSG